MSRQVWQVNRHDETTGRESGYPLLIGIGPLFATKADAQAECDRLLAQTHERDRTVLRQETYGTPDHKWNDPYVQVPRYVPRPEQVLSHEQAVERREEFVAEERASNEERAARLEAEAAALRSHSA